jgi:hypothetical protein
LSDTDAATIEHDDKLAVEENVYTLTGFFTQVENAANELIPDAAVMLSPDRDGLALLLAAIRKSKKDLALAEQTVEDELVKVMGGKYHEVPGLGRIEMHSGGTRKEWDHDTIVAHIIPVIAHDFPKSLVDPEEGTEVPGQEFVARVVAEFRKAGNTNWRTGGGTKPGLRTFGLDPDDYCTTTWGRKTIETPALPERTQAQEEA